jgi:hypothetical protein
MIAVALGLLLSCKKHNDAAMQPLSLQVEIDSAYVLAFTTIHVAASYQDAPTSGIFRWGICWGKTPDPTAIADTIFQPKGTLPPLDTAISNLDSNTVYYIRAFGISGRDTIYGPEKSVKTGGLSVQWDMEYPETEYISIVQVAPAGNGFVVLSEVYPAYSGFPWSRLTRIDSNGNLLWKSDYDFNQYKIPDYVLVQPDGYVVAAHMLAPGTSTATLYKTDLNGNQLWEQQYVDSTWSTQLPAQLYEGDSSTIILTTRSRNYVASTVSYVFGPLQQFTVSQNGNSLGEQTYPNVMNLSSPEVFTSPITANGYLVLYYDDSLAGGFINVPDFRAQAFGAGNVLEWDKTFYSGGLKEEFPVSCQNDSSGNYVVLAGTSAQGTSAQSSWLFGMDRNSGNVLWQNVYSNPKYPSLSSTFPCSFAANAQRDYYVAGSISASAFLLKTDDQGNYIWDYTFNNPAGVVGTSANVVLVYPGNEMYLFGMTSVNGNPVGNMYVRKLKEY